MFENILYALHNTVPYSIAIILTCLTSLDYNFFFKMITLDSIFNSLHFITTLINQNLTESQIITTTNSLYSGSLVDRYIYYSLIYSIYKVICTYFWISDVYYLYLLGMFLTLPIIVNIVLSSHLFVIIREKKEELVKTMIAKILSIIIKFYSRIYLNSNVSIKYKDLLIEDYKESINYFLDLLKNLLIILLLFCVKFYSKSVSYGIIKYMYNFKTGDLLASYNNENSAKEYLLNIINNKSWNELIKPNSIKAIVYLFQINKDESDLFKKISNSFNFSLIQMFTIWTLSSLVNSVYMMPILSFCLLLFHAFIRKTHNEPLLYNILILLFSGVMCHIYPSYLLISAICQYGTLVIFNKITFTIIKTIHKKFIKYSKKILENNKDLTITLILTFFHTMILSYINTPQVLIGIIMNFVNNLLTNNNYKNNIISNIIIFTTYLSKFHPLHIIHNILIMYIVNEIINSNNNYNYQDIFKKIIDIIINRYNSINMKNKNPTNFFNSRYLTNNYNSIIDTKCDTCGNLLITLKDSKSVEYNKENVLIEDNIFNKSQLDFINQISIDDNMPEYNIKKSAIVIVDDFIN